MSARPEGGRARLVVTGASGFVGRALAAWLEHRGHEVLRADRSGARAPGQLCLELPVSAEALPALERALEGVDAVLHLAARAHMVRDPSPEPLAAFRSVNVVGARDVARAALRAGARRFVLVSTAGVLGDSSERGAPLDERSPTRPHTDYARSKLEGEHAVRAELEASAVELVIVRPPLVTGPDPKGNLATLARAIARGVPLPFARVHNRRTLVARDNLVALLEAAAVHPLAAGRTLLATDAEPLSTEEVVRAIALGLEVTPRLFHVPSPLLEALARLSGRERTVRQLYGDLELDGSATYALFGLTPRVTAREGLVSLGRSLRALSARA